MSNKFNRKDFLKMITAAGAYGLLSRGVPFSNLLMPEAFAAGAKPKRLLFVFLRGGLDGLSLVTPIGAQRRAYDAVRAKEKVAIKTLLGLKKGAQASNFWALHPKAKNLQSLYSNDQLNLVLAAGSTNATRSHFEQQDLVERGLGAADSNKGPGFLAKAATALKLSSSELVTLSTATQLSMECTDLDKCSRATVIDNLPNIQRLGKALNPDLLISRQYDVLEHLESQWGASGVAAKQSVETFAASIQMISNQNYGGIEGFRDASAIMRGSDARIVSMSIGGWDHHAGMGVQDGTFDKMITNLDTGLGTFAADLKAANIWNDTVVVVMSEFGRRLQINQSSGCDHGRGGVMLVLGGSVKGGITNENLDISKASHLVEVGNGVSDIAVQTDYRHVMASILSEHMGVNANGLNGGAGSVFSGSWNAREWLRNKPKILKAA